MLNPTFLQQTDTPSANSELQEHQFSMQFHCSVVSLDTIKLGVSISLHLTVPCLLFRAYSYKTRDEPDTCQSEETISGNFACYESLLSYGGDGWCYILFWRCFIRKQKQKQNKTVIILFWRKNIGIYFGSWESHAKWTDSPCYTPGEVNRDLLKSDIRVPLEDFCLKALTGKANYIF